MATAVVLPASVPVDSSGNSTVAGNLTVNGTKATLPGGATNGSFAGVGVQIGASAGIYAQAGIVDFYVSSGRAAQLFANGTLYLNSVAGYSTTWTAQNQAKVEATKTAATYAVAVTDSATTFNNTGAAAQVVYTLPAAAVGLYYTFVNTAAGATFTQLKCSGTDTIAYAGAKTTASTGSLTSSAIWSSVTVECIAAGQWVATAQVGGAFTVA